jgi:tRNA pseudouridine38-40 synthase
MPRYFLEVAYKGTRYSGFQAQQNANTIQAELEKAMGILFRLPVPENGEEAGLRLTGSSRTDAGVHAFQNFFHIDMERKIKPGAVYKLNAILPEDIVVKKMIPVAEDAHCRFDALSREYRYFI